ncbi:putative reverse transcriptase domain-containing protein [Tanacetum coccineum]
MKDQADAFVCFLPYSLVIPARVRAMSMTINSGLKAKILEAQIEASKDLKAPAEWLRGLDAQFKIRDGDGIYFVGRIWIPSVSGIRKLIMDEAHTSRYSVHPGVDQMYYDLRDLYWWPGMKKTLLIMRLPKSSSRYDAIWVIVDRLTKSAHFLTIHEDFKMERFTRIYIMEIVARHGVPNASEKWLLHIKPKQQQQQLIPTTTTISNIKLPILKKEEYDIWAMEMEHYLEYIDNDVWKVIQNGNSKKRISTGKDCVVRILPPVSAADFMLLKRKRKA